MSIKDYIVTLTLWSFLIVLTFMSQGVDFFTSFTIAFFSYSIIVAVSWVIAQLIN